jgi:hypothetical protein
MFHTRQCMFQPARGCMTAMVAANDVTTPRSPARYCDNANWRAHAQRHVCYVMKPCATSYATRSARQCDKLSSLLGSQSIAPPTPRTDSCQTAAPAEQCCISFVRARQLRVAALRPVVQPDRSPRSPLCKPLPRSPPARDMEKHKHYTMCCIELRRACAKHGMAIVRQYVRSTYVRTSELFACTTRLLSHRIKATAAALFKQL